MMERIKPHNKKQESKKDTSQKSEGATHDENGKFAPGHLVGVGGGPKKGNRLLTQQLVSFLHEEVKEGKGKNVVRYARIRRCFESLYTLATSSRVAAETRLETLKFIMGQVDGPMPKVAAEEAAATGGSLTFTLKLGNHNIVDEMSDIQDQGPLGPVINISPNGSNGNGSNGHG